MSGDFSACDHNQEMLPFKYLAAHAWITDFYQLNQRYVTTVIHDSFPRRVNV